MSQIADNADNHSMALIVQKMAALESKMTSLEETHQKEIAKMQTKNQEAEAKAEVLIKKLAHFILTNRQKLDEMEKEIVKVKQQQKNEEIGASNKGKRLANPLENHWYWNPSSLSDRTSADGFCAKCTATGRKYWLNLFAEKGFAISGENSRVDKFAGNILFYYEVTKRSRYGLLHVGLSEGSISDGSDVGGSPNSYAALCTCTSVKCYVQFSKMKYEVEMEVPNCPFKLISNGIGDVFGCGIMLGSTNKVAIFFTLNGILLGQQIPIASPPVDCFYPTVSIYNIYNYNIFLVFEANFGYNRANPFKYDIAKCPGLVFD